MKDKFNKKYLIIILLVLVLFLGASYAFFTEILIGNKKYSVSSGKLQIVLNESNANNHISLTNALPVRDEDGMENEKFNFSLVNNEDEELEYTIYLVEEPQEKKTPSSAIRYYYSRDIGNIEKVRGMVDQQDEEGNFYLETGEIPANTTYNYEFCLWLGYDSDNSVMGTTYSIHLEVEVVQDLTPYTDLVLNGADPVLSPKLVPVLIKNDGTVTKADTQEEWYNYSNKEWANAVVLTDTSIKYKIGDTIPESNIESYFVWIPRYKYKIFNMGNYSSLTSLSNTAVQTIEVVFETKDIPVSTASAVGEWHSHPAFQAFDTNGFWVGKFESGYNGATSTTAAEVNTSDASKLIIKPNVYSWRNITVGNAFKAAYDYMRNEESHMMKNTEWGAVAFLQHSDYGSRSSVRVNNNSAYITGYAATVETTLGYNNGTSISGNLIEATALNKDGTNTKMYNTTTGYTASTTNNISGVYDMSGGAHEYMMAYNQSSSSVGGSSGLTSIYGDFFTSTDWEKYYDKYKSTSETLYSNRILGDATGEMGPYGNVTDPDGSARHRTSWYGDYAYFVTAASPWFYRGGDWYFGVGAGAFAFNNHTGGVNNSLSFRIVLTPSK